MNRSNYSSVMTPSSVKGTAMLAMRQLGNVSGSAGPWPTVYNQHSPAHALRSLFALGVSFALRDVAGSVGPWPTVYNQRPMDVIVLKIDEGSDAHIDVSTIRLWNR